MSSRLMTSKRKQKHKMRMQPASTAVSPKEPEGRADDAGRRPPRLYAVLAAVFAVVLGLAAAAIYRWDDLSPRLSGRHASVTLVAAAARYIGAAECATCHAQEHNGWKGSDHDLAMQVATTAT